LSAQDMHGSCRGEKSTLRRAVRVWLTPFPVDQAFHASFRIRFLLFDAGHIIPKTIKSALLRHLMCFNQY
jgi:hypothetical protein